MEKIRVVALGGLNENGKNCYCIEVDGDIFVIDCGLKYPSINNPGIDFLIPNFAQGKRIINIFREIVRVQASQ